jgi:hypothetical protein
MASEAAILTAADERQLAERGIPVAEAQRHLAVLSRPPEYARLERPCTPGDGIQRLDPARLEGLLACHAAAARAGRVSAFVPASGAATRMFKDLLAAAALPGGLTPAGVAAVDRPEARALETFVAALPRFAFEPALRESLAARGAELTTLRDEGPWRMLIDTLLGGEGLDYASLPKALLQFHRAAEGIRTAFEEHLVEAATLVRDEAGRCRLHVTVSPEHRSGFDALMAGPGAAHAARLGVRYAIQLSEQHPDTDTIAAEIGGGPFRGAAGELLFRPAGHGALLRNLEQANGDLVFLKNIDNVAVDALKAGTARWSEALVGLACELAASAHALRARLDDRADAAAVADAAHFVAETLGLDVPAEPAALVDALDRPLRVCGMVPNTGEPGGGPFWVRGHDGRVTRQVVETAQVAADPAQQEILERATHFNPVFLACALRDRHGQPWPLERFVDPHTAIVTRKSAGGRELLALERPGLWNGAMAGWNTIFVEVPLAVFNPVKTVFDLLRPEHQG